MLEHYYTHTTRSVLHHALRNKGYPAKECAEHAASEVSLLERLPPMLRTLVITDGTVTKILEAFFWEPVVVDTGHQSLTRAEQPIEWLDAPAGEELLARRVRLRGADTGTIYAFAFSLIRTASISPELRQGLLDGLIGIGELIRDCGLESYRELLHFGHGREMAYSHAANSHMPRPLDLVSRTYRIIIGRRSSIVLTESFPLEVYEAAG
jgi:chorismate-pyruvate lyase